MGGGVEPMGLPQVQVECTVVWSDLEGSRSEIGGTDVGGARGRPLC